MGSDSLVHTAADQARSVVLQMMAERGRGVVLVGIARIDLALERLLKAVMAPNPDQEDALFRPERSLGSFAAKISLASRLALIDPAVAKALHALRGVRNDFAHSADATSLAAPHHRKRLAPAYAEARANPLWPPLEAILEAQGGLDADQCQFIQLVTVLVAFIESCARLQQPFQPRATVRFSGGSSASGSSTNRQPADQR
jgi:hypothetical protein